MPGFFAKIFKDIIRKKVYIHYTVLSFYEHNSPFAHSLPISIHTVHIPNLQSWTIIDLGEYSEDDYSLIQLYQRQLFSINPPSNQSKCFIFFKTHRQWIHAKYATWYNITILRVFHRNVFPLKFAQPSQAPPPSITNSGTVGQDDKPTSTAISITYASYKTWIYSNLAPNLRWLSNINKFTSSSIYLAKHYTNLII